MTKPSMQKHQLTIHVCATSVSTMVFSAQGQLLGKAFADVSSRSPEPGWLEVDAEEVWKVSLQTVQEVLTKANIYPEQIGIVGIAAERGDALVWDRITQQALTPVIARKCSRTQKITQDWKKKKLDRLILQRTGLPVADTYSAPKLLWLLGQYPSLIKRARKREVLFGGLESWLLWKMTLGKSHATDYTSAAATMLFDVKKFKWDKQLLKKFKIPLQMLPEVRPSSFIFGQTEQQGPLPAGIPIAAIAADQPAALFALTGLERGWAKTSYDLDCHIMMNIGGRAKFSKTGFATTLACTASKRATYILEGVVRNGGWPVHWLRDSLHLIESIQETSDIAQSVKDSGGIYLVPQHQNSGATVLPGGILGLSSDVSRAHLVRAALESVALETHKVINVLAKEARTGIRSIFVDGPMSQNDFLLQHQADVCNLSIARTRLGETACLGVGFLGGLATKQYKSLRQIQRLRPLDQHFRARVGARDRAKLLKNWEDAVAKIRKGSK